MKVYIKNYEDKRKKLEGQTVYIPVLVVEVDGVYTNYFINQHKSGKYSVKSTKVGE